MRTFGCEINGMTVVAHVLRRSGAPLSNLSVPSVAAATAEVVLSVETQS
jgi:hypothetical protein